MSEEGDDKEPKSGAAAVTTDAYFEAPLTIFRVRDKVEQDVYTYHNGNYILHKSRGGTWSNDDANLHELGIQTLHLRFPSYHQYQSFLTRRTSKILTNPNVPMKEKAEALQNVATPILAGVHKTKGSTDAIQGAVEFIKNCMVFLNDKGGLPSIVDLSSKALDEYGHSLHTAAYAVALAKMAGYGDARELHAIGLGAMFHDIGKSEIEGGILNKEDALSEKEWAIMRQHPAMGENYLDNKSIVPIASKRIVLEHHERPNGKGYPKGTKNIHFFTKIVTIADVFGALISERPYQKARTPFEALKMMVTEMKGEFDEDLLRMFINLLGR